MRAVLSTCPRHTIALSSASRDRSLQRQDRAHDIGLSARLLKQAGLPHSIRFHDMRHSCITLAIANGASAKVVSEMAGHANVSITLSIYQHVLPHMQDGLADGMDSALGEAL